MNVDLICTLTGFLCGLGTGYALWYGREALADSTSTEAPEPEDADRA